MPTPRFVRTGVLVAAAFLAGMLAAPSVVATARSVTYEKLGIFTRVLTYVENNYVEKVESKALLYGAIKGMVATLDPHSAFMTPSEYEEMKVDTNGEFGGIGLEVTKEGEEVVVVSPIDDTPAARAGLRSGDVIRMIDETEVSGLTLPEVVRLMRGPAGSKVVLTIMRKGFTSPKSLSIRRAHIQVNPVTARLVDGYGVIRIKSFQERTDRYVREGLESLEKQSKGELAGLVLDLRNNPGGLLDQAVSVADIWLDEGVIVSTRGRAGHREVQRAHRAGTEPGYPIVVLVNGGTASASEIVAAALHDHGRAVLMGTKTFGKGSVQTVIDLDDGSGLKLTIAKYFTPSNQSIQELGIIPDVEVREMMFAQVDTDVVREEDLDRHIRNPKKGRDEPDRAEEADDFQMKTALDALRTWKIFRAGIDRKPTRASAR